MRALSAALQIAAFPFIAFVALATGFIAGVPTP
jgi:hypothetical protein